MSEWFFNFIKWVSIPVALCVGGVILYLSNNYTHTIIGAIILAIGVGKSIEYLYQKIQFYFKQKKKKDRIEKEIENLDSDCKKVINFLCNNNKDSFSSYEIVKLFSDRNFIARGYHICLNLENKGIIEEMGRTNKMLYYSLSKITRDYISNNIKSG